MKLLIDPTGGIAGDMFTAALVSAGADTEILHHSMTEAALKLGTASILFNRTADGSTQMQGELKPHHSHLGGSRAREILDQLFSELDTNAEYRGLGFRILEILLNAEKIAHADGKFAHLHHHHHDSTETTFLHEAQDIVIDILGAVTGMQNLNIEPAARLLAPVSVGGGRVKFSHGELDVPAPATRIILETFQIPWVKGPIDKELCTPTGAAILAALIGRAEKSFEENVSGLKCGQSRGSKIFDIPPLKIYLPRQ